MSNVFSIKEIEIICNENKQEICFTDENEDRKCFAIDFNSSDVIFLVNQQGNHNKFYELYKAKDVTTYYAIVKYGRIGNKAVEHLYTLEKNNTSEAAFDSFCMHKKWEK